MEISNSERRLTYNVAKELCKQNGINVEGANPAWSYLRLECPLASGVTQFQFPTLQNQTYNGFNQNPTEQRLALQDNFVVGSKLFGFYLWNTVTNKPGSQVITGFTLYNQPIGYQWGTNNNSLSGIPPITLNGLQNEFWNSGWFRYSFDYKVLIPRWDTLQHLFIQRTQATLFTGSTAATSLGYGPQIPNLNGLSDGWVPMEPNIIISGAKNSEIYFNLPFSMSYADLGWEGAQIADGTLQPRLVVMYRGVLLQNTTSVK